MKVKDTGFIQKHIEKLVLVTGVVFLVVVAGMILFGNPHAVEIDNERVSPRQAEARLLEQAERLQQRLRTDDSLETTINQREIPSYARDFQARAERPVIATDRLAIGLGLPGLAADSFGPLEAPDPIYVPAPPVPRDPVARAGYGVLGDAETADEQQALSRFVQNPDTGDFRYVSVSATFNTQSYIQRLEHEIPDGYQRVSEREWFAHNFVAGVFLQRERLDPATGEWGDRRVIDPLPSQIAYGPEAGDRQWAATEAETVVARLRNNQYQIVRPEFVPVAGPLEWLPPEEAGRELTAEEQREISEINNQIRSLLNSIETQQRAIESRGDGASSQMRQRLENDRARLHDLEARRDAIYGIERQEESQDETQTGDDETTQLTGGRLPRGDVQVWAHDLTAQPGQTYRYRVVVTTLNPLFQRARLAEEQIETHYNKVALWPDEAELDASDWSSPVRVDPEHYFFLVDGAPNREEARVEVWRIYRGIWRFEEFDVRPGDLIGGETAIDDRTVSMVVNALLVDLVPIAQGAGSGSGARMIYLDRETNQIRDRIAAQDRENADRTRLRNELERISERAAARN